MPPLFYFALGVFTAFTTERAVIISGVAFLLAASVVLRYAVSIDIARGWCGVYPYEPATWSLIALGGLGIMMAFPIPGQNNELSWMLPNFPINLWHNSTFLFMMPFAALLFKSGMAFLESGGRKALTGVIVYSVLNVLSKPSFFFCFAPVFFIVAIWRLQGRSARLLAAAPVAAGGLVLAATYVHIYYYVDNVGMAGHGVSLFLVWLHYAGNPKWLFIALATANSLLLPIVFFASYPKVCSGDRAVQFAVMLLGVGIAIWVVFHETGERQYHANMGWQVPACNYLLHVAMLGAFARVKALKPKWYARDWLLASIFGIQVLAGITYLGRCAWTGGL
jgi:hypothetical protein